MWYGRVQPWPFLPGLGSWSDAGGGCASPLASTLPGAAGRGAVKLLHHYAKTQLHNYITTLKVACDDAVM